jgi:7-cyano-7-deazaguanine synthase
MKKRTVIGLSGGMDSATLLGILLEQGFTVHCCTFTYGSKHNQYETKAAYNLVHWYKEVHNADVVWHFINMEEAFQDFKSNLLTTGGEIPEGHFENSIMKATVVPGRNLIFASVMAGIAESVGAESICLGVHSGDHAIYPDCRPEFVKALQGVLDASTEGKVQVHTPLLLDNKTSILKKGMSLKIPVPYKFTRTCYKAQPISCGKCGSCQERLEAFASINQIDPIDYEK